MPPSSVNLIVGNTLVVTEENYIPSSIVNDMLAMSMMQNLDCDLEIVFDLVAVANVPNNPKENRINSCIFMLK